LQQHTLYIFLRVSCHIQNNSSALLLAGIVVLVYFIIQDCNIHSNEIVSQKCIFINRQYLLSNSKGITYNPNQPGLITKFLSNQRRINLILDYNSSDLILESFCESTSVLSPLNDFNSDVYAFLLPFIMLLSNFVCSHYKNPYNNYNFLIYEYNRFWWVCLTIKSFYRLNFVNYGMREMTEDASTAAHTVTDRIHENNFRNSILDNMSHIGNQPLIDDNDMYVDSIVINKKPNNSAPIKNLGKL
jgi:hypothetical protein